MRADLLHAARALARMPLVSLTVIVSLAVGVGVNATVFSWIQAVVFHPMPGVRGSGEFHFVEPVSESGARPSASWREFQDLQAGVTSMRDLTAFRMAPLYVGAPGRTERAYGELVAGNFFDALGLTPAAGRLLGVSDTVRPGGERVVVISHDYWRAHFESRADAIGAPLRVNDAVLTVVGVTPRDFQGSVLGLSFDLFLPATLAPVLMPGSTELDDRSVRAYSVMGRLAGGASLTDAARDASLTDAAGDVVRVMAELAAAYPASNRGVTGEVLPFFQAPRGPQRFFASALWFLQVVMLLLLLTVSANTANLVLARAMSRQREVGVRLALGAPPWRIARLLMFESLWLALAAGALGMLAAIWGTEALRAVPMTGAFPVKFQTAVNGGTLVFGLSVALLCGVLFGAAPAAHLARVEPRRALNPGASALPQGSLRGLLMAAQLAVAVVVLAAAGLFVRGFQDSREIDPGFRTDGVLLAAYDLSGRLEAAGARDDAARADGARRFADRLLAALRQQPAVSDATIATAVPLDLHGLPRRTFRIATHPREDGRDDEALTNTVTPGYFAALGIPFVSGGDFAALDDRVMTPQVVVNEAFVSAYLGGAAPVGRTIDSRGRTFTIAGVVETTTYDAFGEAPAPIVYYSYRDRPSGAGEVHLRARPGLDGALASAVRDAVRGLDPELPVYNVRTMTEHIDRNLMLRKIPARMFVVLGPLLVVLAAIGVYAAVAYTVSQRTAEIGLRLALGATAARVARDVTAPAWRASVAGIVMGTLLVAMIDLHLIRGGARDLVVVLGVPLLLAGVAGTACWWPARRAARLAPLSALRRE